MYLEVIKTIIVKTDFSDITLNSKYREGVPEWYPEIQTWVPYANNEQAIVPHPLDPAKKALRIVFDGKIDANTPIRPSFSVFLIDPFVPAPPAYPADGDEFWVEAKYFFPTDFAVTSSNPWFIWCEPFVEYEYHPDLAWPAHNLDANFMVYPDGTGKYYLQMSLVKRRLVDGVYSSIPIYEERWNKALKLPVGEEFTVRWHVKRHLTNGVFEIWLNGEKIIDFIGQTTEKGTPGRVDQGWRTMPLDHYCDPGNPVSTNYLTNLIIATTEADLGPTPTPPIDLPVIASGGLAVVNAVLIGYYLLKHFKIIK